MMRTYRNVATNEWSTPRQCPPRLALTQQPSAGFAIEDEDGGLQSRVVGRGRKRVQEEFSSASSRIRAVDPTRALQKQKHACTRACTDLARAIVEED